MHTQRCFLSKETTYVLVTRDALVWQSIIILALLSKFVYHYRGNNIFAVEENTGLLIMNIETLTFWKGFNLNLNIIDGPGKVKTYQRCSQKIESILHHIDKFLEKCYKILFHYNGCLLGRQILWQSKNYICWKK